MVLDAASLTAIVLIATVSSALFLRGRSRGGRSGATPTADQIRQMGLISTTNTQTSTQGSTSVTLSPAQTPMYIETSAVGTTGRFRILLPDGTSQDFQCVPNAPAVIYKLPPVFSKPVVTVTFSAITVDGTGTVVATIWGKPSAA